MGMGRVPMPSYNSRVSRDMHVVFARPRDSSWLASVTKVVAGTDSTSKARPRKRIGMEYTRTGE